MKIFGLLVASMILTSACASVEKTHEAKAVPSSHVYLFQSATSESTSELSIERDSSQVGATCNYAIYFDKKLAAKIAVSEKVVFHLPPTIKYLKIVREAQGEGLCSLTGDAMQETIKLEPGEKKDLKLTTTGTGIPVLVVPASVVTSVDYCDPKLNSVGKISLAENPGKISTESFLKFVSDSSTEHEGASIAWKGDLNSDGIDDYIVKTGNAVADVGANDMIALASCPNGDHAKVLQASLNSFKVEADQKLRWKNIQNESYGFSDKVKCPEGEKPKLASNFSTYEFAASDYKKARDWQVIADPPCQK